MNFVKIKTSKCNNKGFTLIEVIISMLILAIVAIPILRSFNVSMRTNIRADDRAAAVEYSQQLMESLQTYGAAAVEKEFTGRKFNLAELADGGAGEATDRGFVNRRTEEIKAGSSRYYRILGAEAAGREYDAQISYSPAKTAYNMSDFPDISAFDKEKTVILNPAGSYVDYISDTDGYMYDVSSKSYIGYRSNSYENIYTESIYAVYKAAYQQICAAVNEALLEKNPQILSSQLLQLKALMPDDAEVRKRALTRSVERKTAIKIRHTKEGFFIMAVLDYSLKGAASAAEFADLQAAVNRHCIEAGTALPELNSMVANIWAETMREENFHHSYMIYKSAEPVQKLQSVYLMYDPLKASEWANDSIALDMSDVISEYNDSNRLSLYIVPQKGLIGMSNDTDYRLQSTDYIAPFITGAKISGNSATDIKIAPGGFSGGLLKLHYMKGFFSESGAFAASNSIDNIVAKEAEERDYIFDIKIKIYKHATGREKPFDKSKMLTELNLTGY